MQTRFLCQRYLVRPHFPQNNSAGITRQASGSSAEKVPSRDYGENDLAAHRLLLIRLDRIGEWELEGQRPDEIKAWGNAPGYRMRSVKG